MATPHVINVKGVLYFVTHSTVWKVVGSAVYPAIGDVALELHPTIDPQSPPLVEMNGILYFSASKRGSTNGETPDYELWRTNGTTGGTFQVKDIYPGKNPYGPVYLTNVNGTLFFATNSEDLGGYKLWKSNGTTAGTIQIENPAIYPKNLTNVNGTLFFSASQYTTGSDEELWKSDGTKEGTVRLTNSFVNELYPLEEFININGNLYFRANTDLYGKELWKSDGTTAGTTLVNDILPGSEGSKLGNLININGTLYFGANNGSHGRELWKYNPGTCASIIKKDIIVEGGTVCAGSKGIITIKTSQIGVNYQAVFNNSVIGNLVQGNGGDITLTIPAVSLSLGNNIFKVRATGCTVADLTNTATIIISDCLTPVTCSATGSILQEKWLSVQGNLVSQIPVNTTPASSAQLTSFETTPNQGDNYGERICGYLCAPYSGSYTFYLSGDDQAELYLSTDEDPSKKTKIASIAYFTGSREWNKYPSQKSVALSLVAGKKYYIEALHKEGLYADNLSVGWQTPAQAAISVIAGSYLSPFIPACSNTAQSSLVGNPSNGSILAEIPST